MGQKVSYTEEFKASAIKLVNDIPIANEKVGNNLVFTIAQNNGITQL